MDGIAWTQLVVGDTVYVGGSFANARPANAAPGVSTVPRTHLMAYTLSTGELTSFAPTVNAQVRSLAASTDGKTLYVGGQFTTINGVTRNRIAAFNIATGALTTFNPNSNSTVLGLTVSGSTLFAAGNFTAISGVARLNGAGINLTTGALTGFNPAPAGGTIQRLAASPDGSKVVVGGNFTAMGGSSTPGYGLALLNAATGRQPADAGEQPDPQRGQPGRDHVAWWRPRTAAGSTDPVTPSGRRPATSRAPSGRLDGNLVWVEDCHGDTYSSSPSGDAVYVAGHPHYCGNLGGFPQTPPVADLPRVWPSAMRPPGCWEKDPYGYFNYEGQPGPTLLNWFPDITPARSAASRREPWTVTGNADYVLYGGEFTTVNCKAQQGLVRFARTGIAPNTQGPRLQDGRLRAHRHVLRARRAPQLAREPRPRQRVVDLLGDQERQHRQPGLHHHEPIDLLVAAAVELSRQSGNAWHRSDLPTAGGPTPRATSAMAIPSPSPPNGGRALSASEEGRPG